MLAQTVTYLLPCGRVAGHKQLTFSLLACGAMLWLTAPEAQAQTVQLPTFGTFSIGTTVNVPDRGGALLGGVTRGASSSISRGVPGLGNVPYAGRLFRNRAIGTNRSASTSSVHATIIDFEAMDKALLAEAARIREARQNDPRFDRPAEPAEEVKRKAAFLSRNIGRNK